MYVIRKWFKGLMFNKLKGSCRVAVHINLRCDSPLICISMIEALI
jgi:hypothetical protein